MAAGSPAFTWAGFSGAPVAGMNCVQLTFRSARVDTFAGDKPPSFKGGQQGSG
jgi:hypothetical protein